MNDDSEIDAEARGYVIVSFSVTASAPIDGLAQYRRPSPAERETFFYDLGTETFDEPEAQRRADRLEATILGFLDLVAPIPRDVLHHPQAFVRLFMTLGPGAETISAETLKCLADANATIWIDV